jgi:hypothetical protein
MPFDLYPFFIEAHLSAPTDDFPQNLPLHLVGTDGINPGMNTRFAHAKQQGEHFLRHIVHIQQHHEDLLVDRRRPQVNPPSARFGVGSISGKTSTISLRLARESAFSSRVS